MFNSYHQPRTFVRPSQHMRSRTPARSEPRPQIAPHTGPLDVLEGREALVLADIENLSYSAQKQLGYKVSYRTLTTQLLEVSASCALHAFFSVDPARADQRRAYFEARGWTVHNRRIETVRTHAGEKTLANVDNLLLFQAGLLCSRTRADTVVLASGDGDLVNDLANALSNLPTPRRVITLSLAGSTSWRLNAARNPRISANMELGLDCLRPLYPR